MSQRKIEESIVVGQRLGRHVNHDPRSLRFPFKSSTPLTSAKHESHIPILDQGDLGSCTGNATVGALGCSPFYETLGDVQKAALNEAEAVSVYSLATTLDSFPGTYKPTDTGSDGLSAAKAAAQKGYISGYVHALSLNDALAALVAGPVIIGIDWYEGFDTPDASGAISISGKVRGGHEICLDQIDVENQRVWIKNSWGTSYGLAGRVNLSFKDLGTLLSSDGDCTVFVPISAPAPTPTPVPPTPTPGGPTAYEQALLTTGDAWEKTIVSRVTKSGKFKTAFDEWKTSKGF